MVAATKKRHKSFTKKDPKKYEPLGFDLYNEDFEAYPALQGAVLLEFVAAMSDGDDDNEGGASAGLILEFFKKALKPESFERFDALIHDPERIVEAEELAEIMGYLMEEYTSRDLEDASSSSENS